MGRSGWASLVARKIAAKNELAFTTLTSWSKPLPIARLTAALGKGASLGVEAEERVLQTLPIRL